MVFVEAENAYAAVRVVWGGYKWMETELPAELRDRLERLAPAGAFNTTRFIPENATMVLNEEYAPVILEVMAKGDIKSFDAFKAKIKGCEMRMDAAILRYTTIYGDALTFDTSFAETPSINGKRVNYAPQKVFESPFLNADYNSGVVTISKGTRKKVLEF